MDGVVEGVSRSATHGIGKDVEGGIRLIENLGVEGDVHAGRTVQHLSRMKRQPASPNLRQVHLIAGELHDELRAAGYDVAPGRMGENVTTRGVDLLSLPVGTRLAIGAEAIVEITGLRNPCRQLERIGRGLMAAVLDRDDDGALVRRAGIMAVVVRGGDVRPGDGIRVALPSPPHRRLDPV
jgi:MOSC domain-containing protein YiiM